MNKEAYELAKGLQNSNIAEVALIAKSYVELYEECNQPYNYEEENVEDLSYEDYDYTGAV